MTDGNAVESTPAPRLGYLIGRMDRLVRLSLESALHTADMSLAQYTAMSVLAARPGLSNAQLARRSLVTPQAMFQALAKLADRGLIERKPHATKGRVLCVELTAAGYEALADLDAAVDLAEAKMLAPLTPPQQQALIASLAVLAEVRVVVDDPTALE